MTPSDLVQASDQRTPPRQVATFVLDQERAADVDGSDTTERAH